MRFEDAYEGWTEQRLTQEEAAQLLSVCPRTFRRTINQYDKDGVDGLIDKRSVQASRRRASVTVHSNPSTKSSERVYSGH